MRSLNEKKVIIDDNTRNVLNIFAPFQELVKNDSSAAKDKPMAIVDRAPTNAPGVANKMLRLLNKSLLTIKAEDFNLGTGKHFTLPALQLNLDSPAEALYDNFIDYLNRAILAAGLSSIDTEKPVIDNYFVLVRELLKRIVYIGLHDRAELKLGGDRMMNIFNIFLSKCGEMDFITTERNFSTFWKTTVPKFTRSLCKDLSPWKICLSGMVQLVKQLNAPQNTNESNKKYFEKMRSRIQSHLITQLAQSSGFTGRKTDLSQDWKRMTFAKAEEFIISRGDAGPSNTSNTQRKKELIEFNYTGTAPFIITSEQRKNKGAVCRILEKAENIEIIKDLYDVLFKTEGFIQIIKRLEDSVKGFSFLTFGVKVLNIDDFEDVIDTHITVFNKVIERSKICCKQEGELASKLAGTELGASLKYPTKITVNNFRQSFKELDNINLITIFRHNFLSNFENISDYCQQMGIKDVINKKNLLALGVKPCLPISDKPEKNRLQSAVSNKQIIATVVGQVDGLTEKNNTKELFLTELAGVEITFEKPQMDPRKLSIFAALGLERVAAINQLIDAIKNETGNLLKSCVVIDAQERLKDKPLLRKFSYLKKFDEYNAAFDTVDKFRQKICKHYHSKGYPKYEELIQMDIKDFLAWAKKRKSLQKEAYQNEIKACEAALKHSAGLLVECCQNELFIPHFLKWQYIDNPTELTYRPDRVNTLVALVESHGFSLHLWQEKSSKKSSSQKGYERHPTAGNGDCGYIAYGITREEAFRLLSDNLLVIRDIIKPAIKGVLLITDFYDYLIQQGAINKETSFKQVKAKIEQYALDLNIQKTYIHYNVKEKRYKNGRVHPSILQALAKIQSVELYQWLLGEREELIPQKRQGYHDFSVYKPKNAKSRKDVLFVNNNHMERITFKGYQKEYPGEAEVIYPYNPKQSSKGYRHKAGQQ